jgi:hypothetical protein
LYLRNTGTLFAHTRLTISFIYLSFVKREKRVQTMALAEPFPTRVLRLRAGRAGFRVCG